MSIYRLHTYTITLIYRMLHFICAQVRRFIGCHSSLIHWECFPWQFGLVAVSEKDELCVTVPTVTVFVSVAICVDVTTRELVIIWLT